MKMVLLIALGRGCPPGPLRPGRLRGVGGGLRTLASGALHGAETRLRTPGAGEDSDVCGNRECAPTPGRGGAI